MKFHTIFADFIKCSNESEVFQYFIETLTNSITVWDYFVDWQKVLSKFNNIEIYLHSLNYLIGKKDIEDGFRKLLKEIPAIAGIVPILIACRHAEFKILADYNLEQFEYKSFNFQNTDNLSESEINDIIDFIQNTGLLELLQNQTIKSIPDYVLGIEVGLDTNARKNRSGTIMEQVVENLISSICQENNFSYIPQATSQKIKSEFQIDVKVDKSNRRFDFAIKNKNILYLIETNFYGGGGSKPKATAGEYKTLFNFVSSQGHKFIWITDGLGWTSTLHPLEETFNHIDYTLNLQMISSGLLAELIRQQL